MKTTLVGMLVPLAVLAACNRAETPPDNAATVTSEGAMPIPPPGTTPASNAAIAVLAGTKDSPVRGELRLTEAGGGVDVVGEIAGLAAGSEHGFHVHEHGDCSAPDASSAGGHLNPGNAPHGGPGVAEKHLGDMPNIKADEQGRVDVQLSIAGATLRDGGPNNLVGKAFVVHAKADDYKTQPSGDAGDRIACGVVR